MIESDIGYDPSIVEITITDNNGVVIASSDASLRGEKVPPRPSINSLANAGFFQQLQELFGPPQNYEDSLPFDLDENPYGEVRVGLSSAFLRTQIRPGLVSAAYWALGAVLVSTFLALVASGFSLAPLERISAQLDRISAGQFDLEPAVARGDELLCHASLAAHVTRAYPHS